MCDSNKEWLFEGSILLAERACSVLEQSFQYVPYFRPLTQNNMQVQQMGPLNCSLPAHNIFSCCMVLVQWFIGVILKRNLLLHLTQILSVSPAWAVTCNYGRRIVAAALEIYPREHCELYMGKGVAKNVRNGGLTKAKFNLGGRGNWAMMMMVVKACAKLLGCVKQTSGHYFHADHVRKLLFPSFSVCCMSHFHPIWHAIVAALLNKYVNWTSCLFDVSLWSKEQCSCLNGLFYVWL
jgi:hypothetical protein